MLKKVLLLSCALSSVITTPSWSTVVPLSSKKDVQTAHQSVGLRTEYYLVSDIIKSLLPDPSVADNILFGGLTSLRYWLNVSTRTPEEYRSWQDSLFTPRQEYADKSPIEHQLDVEVQNIVEFFLPQAEFGGVKIPGTTEQKRKVLEVAALIACCEEAFTQRALADKFNMEAPSYGCNESEEPLRFMEDRAEDALKKNKPTGDQARHVRQLKEISLKFKDLFQSRIDQIKSSRERWGTYEFSGQRYFDAAQRLMAYLSKKCILDSGRRVEAFGDALTKEEVEYVWLEGIKDFDGFPVESDLVIPLDKNKALQETPYFGLNDSKEIIRARFDRYKREDAWFYLERLMSPTPYETLARAIAYELHEKEGYQSLAVDEIYKMFTENRAAGGGPLCSHPMPRYFDLYKRIREVVEDIMKVAYEEGKKSGSCSPYRGLWKKIQDAIKDPMVLGPHYFTAENGVVTYHPRSGCFWELEAATSEQLKKNISSRLPDKVEDRARFLLTLLRSLGRLQEKMAPYREKCNTEEEAQQFLDDLHHWDTSVLQGNMAIPEDDDVIVRKGGLFSRPESLGDDVRDAQAFFAYVDNCQSAIDSLLDDNEALWRAAHEAIAKEDFMEKVGQFSRVGREGYKHPVFRWQGKLTDREFRHEGADELRPLIDAGNYQQVWDFILKMHSVNRMIHLIERAHAQRLKELSAEQLRRLNAWKNPDSFDEPDAANPEANQGKIRSLLELFLEVSCKARLARDKVGFEQLASVFEARDGITALDDFAHVNDELKKEDYDEFFSKMNVADIDALNVQPAANPPAAAQSENIIRLAAFYHALLRPDQEAFKRILFDDFDDEERKIGALQRKLSTDKVLSAMRKKGDETPGPTGENGYKWGELGSEREFIMGYVRHGQEKELLGVLELGKQALTEGLTEDRFDAQMEPYKPRPKEASTDIILKGLAQGIVDLSKNIDAFFELRQETYNSEGWGKAKEQLLTYAEKDMKRDSRRFVPYGREAGSFND